MRLVSGAMVDPGHPPKRRRNARGQTEEEIPKCWTGKNMPETK